MTTQMINPLTMATKQVPAGFSVTSLFFGFFVPLFRGDVILALGTVVASMLTFGAVGVGVWIWQMFCYNSYHIQKLEEVGWMTRARYEAMKQAEREEKEDARKAAHQDMMHLMAVVKS